MVWMSKRKKSFPEVIAKEEKGDKDLHHFSLEEAVERLEKFPKVKFDESVELHLHLNLEKDTDQSVRGTVVLPHGTGKKVRIVVICKGEDVVKAENLGADHVGDAKIIEKIQGGWLDFDCLISTPEMMRDVSKLGKVLGPRGLMPSPKAGTVTNDLEKTIKEIKAGRVEFKADKQAGIHVAIGKRSFSKEQLLENAHRLLDALHHAKPSSVKGSLFKSLFLSSTMGPGLKLAL